MHTSTIIHILLVVCAKFYQCFASYDSMMSSSHMSLATGAVAVAYDENNNTILLIGGSDYRRQFMTFKDNTFTLINQYYLTTAQQTFGFGQHYTTLYDELWIIREDGTGFITFNLNTYAVNTPSITLQTNVDYRGCLTSIAQYIVVLGGGGGGDGTGDTLDTVQMYDINEDVWLQNVPNMLQKRRSFACLVVNDNVYAIGGNNGSSIRLDTIEALDVSNMDSIQSNQWHMLQGTLSQRIDGNRAVQYNTDIIVIGGAINDALDPVIDIHLIDTVTGSCDVMGALEVPLSLVSPIIVDTTLHIFGGYATSGYTNTYQYISLPTSFPTTDPTATPTESTTTKAIPQTSEIATETGTTIKAAETSTSLLSTLDTTQIATETATTIKAADTSTSLLSTLETTQISTSNPTMPSTSNPTVSPTTSTLTPTESATRAPTPSPIFHASEFSQTLIKILWIIIGFVLFLILIAGGSLIYYRRKESKRLLQEIERMSVDKSMSAAVIELQNEEHMDAEVVIGAVTKDAMRNDKIVLGIVSTRRGASVESDDDDIFAAEKSDSRSESGAAITECNDNKKGEQRGSTSTSDSEELYEMRGLEGVISTDGENAIAPKSTKRALEK